jgi:phosphatidylserine/phosphatidylglycerophosphate/cardiolipin synthase-like enzyme
MTENYVRVVVSGSSWMGSGFGSIESALHDLFNLANDEVIFIAFNVSGAIHEFFQQIEQLLERGIRIRMLVNRYDSQHESLKLYLGKLKRQFPDLLLLFSFMPDHNNADLHAKIILVDRKYALVGSANLSLRGLMDNHEFALLVEGNAVADVTRAVDLIFKSAQTLPVK